MVVSFLLSRLITNASTINGECVSLGQTSTNEKFERLYDWNYINFTWPSVNEYSQAVNTGKYVPEHNAIVGVKFFNDRLYLALPKAKSGAPVTLAYVQQEQENVVHATNPLLTPYPSWKWNTDPDCRYLQNVQSMEIDRKGVMWVLDGRRVDKTETKCPPKIVLLDLNANGKVLKSYIVPDGVCRHESCFLNDLVLDEYDGGYAYITDTSADPGLIVYSRKHNRSWKVRDATMHAQLEAANFSVQGHVHSHSTPIDGIAMEPASSLDDPSRMVYYTALTGLNLYAIRSDILRDEALATTSKVHEHIIDVGQKSGPSDGLVMDSERNLFYGVLTKDSVEKWNASTSISTAKTVDQNSDLIFWPDSFGFDTIGNMYLVSNNIGYFLENDISREKINFRLLKFYTGTCSYLY
ncbi:yellow-b [Carabus blaptoides fortunei]